ncbi:integrase [Streptomyces sp. NRRL S-337]|uniref:integrase n=1 Tax=Streptomyces sp. NRRL S-337 TaxID=1463900 RepID=UPI000AD9A7B0|nr:integrase [Streptomyces sp. NRRL S-337]
MEQRSAQHEIDLRPQKTVDGYAADWKQWEVFCALLDLPATAITPGFLTAFVEWLWWQPGWNRGRPRPPRAEGQGPRVAEDRRGPRSRTGPCPAPRPPAGRPGRHPRTRLGIRDRAIILLQFAIAGREHEVARLRLRDIVEVEHGLEVDVRVSKISPRKVKVPFGSRPSTCPVGAWRAWTEAAGLTDPDGYAFRALNPVGTPSPTAACPPRPSAPSPPASASGPSSPSGTPDTPPAAAPPRSPAAPATTARPSPSRADGSPTAGSWRAEDADGWEENVMIGVL